MSKATYYVQDCPTCGRGLRVRVEYLGRMVACQHCSGRFIAQDPASGAPAPSDSGVYMLKRAEELLAASSGILAGDSSKNLLTDRWVAR